MSYWTWNAMYLGNSRARQNSTARQRPTLLRSSATEPSITPSNSVQASLCSPESASNRATDLLNRVAVYLPAQCGGGSGGSDAAQAVVSDHDHHHQVSQSIMIGEGHDQAEGGADMSISDSSSSGCYFSFPNFDNWESPKQDGDKETYP